MSSLVDITFGHSVVTDEPALPAQDNADDNSIESLVERAQAGDARAFAQIVSRYDKRVLGIAWRLLRNREDAMDAAQETFVRLYKYLGTYDRSRDLGAWLYRIVVNASRKLAAQRARAQAAVPPRGEASDVAAGLPASRDIERAMAALTEKERAALVLRDLEGLSTEEVARILGSSQATVRVQVCTARKKIRRYLDDSPSAPGDAPKREEP